MSFPALARRICLLAATTLLVPGFASATDADPGQAVQSVGVDADLEGPSLDARLQEIRHRVARQVLYPEIARARGTTGVTLVGFEIDSNGNPLGIETLASSGSLVLDRAAASAVEQAAPYPWVHGRVEVPVAFQLRQARRR